jgi:hypothetical protein
LHECVLTFGCGRNDDISKHGAYVSCIFACAAP